MAVFGSVGMSGASLALAVAAVITISPAPVTHAAAAAGAAQNAPAATWKPPVYWIIPAGFTQGFGPKPSDFPLSSRYQQLSGARSSIAAGRYQMRKLKWTKWGKAKVTGSGQARLCSGTCGPWRKARIVLSGKSGATCGDSSSPTQYSYTAYRLYGFPGVASGHRVVSPYAPC